MSSAAALWRHADERWKLEEEEEQQQQVGIVARKQE
jgi:hypothetical protein